MNGLGPVQDLATSEEHPALLPPHPAVRARARIIMDHFNTQFVPLFYRILVRYQCLLALIVTMPVTPGMALLEREMSRKLASFWCDKTCLSPCLTRPASPGLKILNSPKATAWS